MTLKQNFLNLLKTSYIDHTIFSTIFSTADLLSNPNHALNVLEGLGFEVYCYTIVDVHRHGNL